MRSGYFGAHIIRYVVSVYIHILCDWCAEVDFMTFDVTAKLKSVKRKNVVNDVSLFNCC